MDDKFAYDPRAAAQISAGKAQAPREDVTTVLARMEGRLADIQKAVEVLRDLDRALSGTRMEPVSGGRVDNAVNAVPPLRDRLQTLDGELRDVISDLHQQVDRISTGLLGG